MMHAPESAPVSDARPANPANDAGQVMTLDAMITRIQGDRMALAAPDVIAYAAGHDPVSLRAALDAAKIKPGREWWARIRDVRKEAEAAAKRAREERAREEQRHGRAGMGRQIDAIQIVIAPGQLPRQVEQGIRALVSNDDNLFQQGQELVRVVVEPGTARKPRMCEARASIDDPCDACAVDAGEPCAREYRSGASIVRRAGTPRLTSISAAVLKERLAMAAEWLAPEGGDDAAPHALRPANPPGDVVAVIHERKEWPGIRPVRGIAEAPFMRPDWSVCDVPGYDDATGFYYHPSGEFPRVPARPTRAESRAALRRLWIEAFGDFPYRGMPEHDPADVERLKRYEHACSCPDAFVGIACLFGILARPAIDGAIPTGAFEAASKGSGKTKQIHAVSIIATGRPAGVATFPMRQGAPNDEEAEKVLAGYALGGAQIVAFDNIRGTLGGAALEKVQTAAETVVLRVLGRSGQVEIPWSAVLMVSGNNMAMTGDVADRTLVSRLESPRSDPRSRPITEFRHPNLFAALRAMRPQLLRDALIVLRAYAVASAQDKRAMADECGTLGSFEGWSEIIPRAIRYAGGPNILDARVMAEDADPETAAHETLMRLWPCEDWTRAADIITRAFAHETEAKAEARKGINLPPDGLDDLRGAIRDLTDTPPNGIPSGVDLGNALRSLRGKWIGDSRLVERKKPDGKTVWKDRTGAVLWRVERRATSAAAPPPEATTPPEEQPAAPSPAPEAMTPPEAGATCARCVSLSVANPLPATTHVIDGAGIRQPVCAVCAEEYEAEREAAPA